MPTDTHRCVRAAATVDGLQVKRDGLSFDVTRDGKPVAVEDYLGAKGHLVALREGDLAFLHVHPDADRLKFAATFPNAEAPLLRFLDTRGVDEPSYDPAEDLGVDGLLEIVVRPLLERLDCVMHGCARCPRRAPTRCRAARARCPRSPAR